MKNNREITQLVRIERTILSLLQCGKTLSFKINQKKNTHFIIVIQLQLQIVSMTNIIK